jgi:glycerol 3-phosphatase-2
MLFAAKQARCLRWTLWFDVDLIERIDAFLIDLDGVVYVGDHALPGAVEAVTSLRQMGKSICFLTNDPRSSRHEYVDRLRELGIDVTPDAVVTAGWTTARFVADELRAKRAFVVGSRALKQDVKSAGVAVVDDDADVADVVVVGGHPGFDYAELRTASRLARGGAELVATGRDATFPMPDGLWPATGSIVAAVEVASGTRAHVVGKPEPHMFATAASIVGIEDPRRVAVVGDTPRSDIVGGRRAGLVTVLVGDVDVDDPSMRADFRISSLAQLVS